MNINEVPWASGYKQAYNIEVQDMKQPLLLSMPKARDRRRGQEGPQCILPELCSLTGLADEVRADFNVMKDLAVHTRIGPADRVKRLQKFISDISRYCMSKLQNLHHTFLYGCTVVLVAALHVWNSLPSSITASETLGIKSNQITFITFWQP